MVVYVKIRVIAKTERSRDLVVLVSGGAHSPRPVIVVDEKIGRDLGFELFNGEICEVRTVDSRRSVYLFRDAVKLELLGDEREVLSTITADLVIHPDLIEPLITDTTIDALGIKVESFSKGLWRHINDPQDKVRKSAK